MSFGRGKQRPIVYNPMPSSYGGGTQCFRGGDLTGNADSQKCTMSFWMRDKTGGGFRYFIVGTTNQRYQVEKSALARFVFFIKNAAGTEILNFNGNMNLVPVDFQWHHYIWSVDFSANKCLLYIDDVDQSNAYTSRTFTNGQTCDWTDTEHYVSGLTAGLLQMGADLSEYYFNNAEFIDISVKANREKFVVDGKSRFLGDKGELPTGNQPIVYAPEGNPGLNRGYGGNFSYNTTRPAYGSNRPPQGGIYP